MNNTLVVLENSRINTYLLDQKEKWCLGRPSKDNDPDIKLLTASVSRNHGELRCIDGYWFYVDSYRKNGTVYNGKPLVAGLGGRAKPIMLNDGDTLLFGTKNENSISLSAPWAIFIRQGFEDRYTTIDTKGIRQLNLAKGEETESIKEPKPGTVIKRDDGMAIYMGNVTYLFGDMRIVEV